MKKNLDIYVTQPSLPPLEDFIPYLKEIWDSKILTNGGPMHRRLEAQLAEYLGVKYISLFSNGTLALLTALQSLRITGEVITTPYSFVATAHSLMWNGIKPIFVDIDPLTFNMDPKKIEAAITPQTTAIMPVHCYGRPCDVEAIKKIADIYNLKIIYDAAHAFGVRNKCGSILNHGDLSALSFHATKVFNTFEGGAVISHSIEEKQRIDNLKNFGFLDELTVVAPGINGKMSEINSAFGLLQLEHVKHFIDQRRNIDAIYRSCLRDIKGIKVHSIDENWDANFSYFPIFVENEYGVSRDELYELLKNEGIFTRRYFYPLISNFPMYQSLQSSVPSNLPVATDVSKRILCLPIYADLNESEALRIVELISKYSK